MNKFETAIADITNRAEHTLKTKLSAETAEIAVEALGKQMPQKVLIENISKKIFRYICPHCFFQLIEGQNCCDDCGQRLEW